MSRTYKLEGEPSQISEQNQDHPAPVLHKLYTYQFREFKTHESTPQILIPCCDLSLLNKLALRENFDNATHKQKQIHDNKHIYTRYSKNAARRKRHSCLYMLQSF